MYFSHNRRMSSRNLYEGMRDSKMNYFQLKQKGNDQTERKHASKYENLCY